MKSLLFGLAAALVAASHSSMASESGSTPFKEAAAEAAGIVRARVTGDDKSGVRLEVLESIRGTDTPRSILVSRSLWDIWSPKNVPAGEVTYLVLLRQGEELLCGHMNGLILLSHGCVGILPVINDSIPKQFAK